MPDTPMKWKGNSNYFTVGVSGYGIGIIHHWTQAVKCQWSEKDLYLLFIWCQWVGYWNHPSWNTSSDMQQGKSCCCRLVKYKFLMHTDISMSDPVSSHWSTKEFLSVVSHWSTKEYLSVVHKLHSTREDPNMCISISYMLLNNSFVGRFSYFKFSLSNLFSACFFKFQNA